MAATHGSKAKFRVQDSGGTLRDVSAFLTDAGLDRDADTAEVSTLGATDKTHIPGLRGGTVPISGVIDPTLDGYLNGILGMERNFEYDPQGAGTGLVRYSGACILRRYGLSTGVGAAGESSGEFVITGAVTRSLQA